MQAHPEGHCTEGHAASCASAAEGAFVMPPHCAYGCSVSACRGAHRGVSRSCARGQACCSATVQDYRGSREVGQLGALSCAPPVSGGTEGLGAEGMTGMMACWAGREGVGAFEVGAGAAAFVVAGAFVVGAGATVVAAGALDVGAGALVVGAGAFVVGAGAWVVGAGTWVVGAGAAVVAKGAFVVGAGAFVVGAGAFVLGGGAVLAAGDGAAEVDGGSVKPGGGVGISVEFAFGSGTVPRPRSERSGNCTLPVTRPCAPSSRRKTLIKCGPSARRWV